MPNIVSNVDIQATSWDSAALRRAFFAYDGPIGRPLATLSFAINHILTGLDPWWMKATNLGIHLANGLLIGTLARKFLALGWKARTGYNVSLAATGIALTWMIHPLQVSSVLYIVQRMELLATTCILLALHTYFQGRIRQISMQRGGWYWLAASGLLSLLGAASKENAVLTPLFMLATEFTLLHFSAAAPRDSKILRGAHTAALALLLTALAVATIHTMPSYSTREFTMYERVLSQLRVLVTYLQWMVWPSPSNLTFYHDDFVTSRGLLAPWTTLASGAFLGLLASLSWLMRSSRPISSLGIILFFCSHIITSSAIPLEQIFEHRNYFALFGVILFVADTLAHALPRNSIIASSGTVIAITLGLGWTTVLRSAMWGNPTTLAISMAEHNPSSARAAYDLGIAYLELSDYRPDSPIYPKAIQALEHAGSIPGSSPLPEQALILLASNNGSPGKGQWWDGLQRKIEANAPGPQEFTAIYALHASRMKGSTLPINRLQPLYESFLRKNPDNIYMNLIYSDFARVVLKDETLARKHRNIAESIRSK
ncbi:hypothetical protein [Lysobacter sp. F60174L2]|uniref:hypothetical protein n=1 Tax=Lysobacter sp. F60174L2 TaxID=3459295 RepID=UPI00403DE2FB